MKVFIISLLVNLFMRFLELVDKINKSQRQKIKCLFPKKHQG